MAGNDRATLAAASHDAPANPRAEAAPYWPADLAGPAFKADPWAGYAELREQTPLARVRTPGGEEAYLVTRHADVRAMLRDDRIAKDPANAPPAPDGRRRRTRQPPPPFSALTANMLNRDDPDHARLRRLMQTAFTPRRVATLADRTRATAHALLDRIEPALRRGRPVDLMAGFAVPLPVTVISELFGVPEADRARFAGWSRALLGITPTPLGMLRAIPGTWALVRYLRRLAAARRARPADDLTSALAAEVAGEAQGGGRLDDEELVAMLALVLTAGHETTTNLIGNGTLALLTTPGAWDVLRATAAAPADDGPAADAPPADAPLAAAVEELLRAAGPVETTTPRFAREPFDVAGVRVPAGALVLGGIASANRDPAAFPDAEQLRLDRAPNRHLTFGEGGHYCLGAPLARLEGRIAFAALAERLPALCVAGPTAPPRWRASLVLRGLGRLPVRLGGHLGA